MFKLCTFFCLLSLFHEVENTSTWIENYAMEEASPSQLAW